MAELSFWVPGKPEPQGSKKPVRYGGHGHVIIVDDNPKGANWKKVIGGHAVRQVGRPQLEGPLAMCLRFVLQRPKRHHVAQDRARPVRPDAPAWPTVKPDTLKLARAVEDALTGILYLDDAQIVIQTHSKHYGPQTGVQVEIRPVKEEPIP